MQQNALSMQRGGTAGRNALAQRPSAALPQRLSIVGGRMHSVSPRQLQPIGCPIQTQLVSLQPPQQQHHHHQAPRRPQVPCASSSDASGSGAAAPGGKPQRGSWMTWFDRLPANTQLMVMGGLLFVAAIVMPFLQPTFLYGDSSSKPGGGGHQVTQTVQQAQLPERYSLPRYIPGASELYDFLQDNAMPRVLPDGRSESPGVVRIYTASMIILAVFYACSAVLSLILRGVAGVLRAVGVMGPAPPPAKPDEQQ